jgi:hypothetical protein
MEKRYAYREIAGYSALSLLSMGVFAVEYTLMSFDTVFRKAMDSKLKDRYRNIDLINREEPSFILDRFINQQRTRTEQAHWIEKIISNDNLTRTFYLPRFDVNWYNERFDEGKDSKQLVADYISDGYGAEPFGLWKQFGDRFITECHQNNVPIVFREKERK